MSSGAPGAEFNWNRQANYVVLAAPGEEFTAVTRVLDVQAPTDDSQIPGFIQTHGLRHGDVINLDPSYRFSECVIVIRDGSTGAMGWTQNPDDAGAGYLTIPESVLENVTDFKSKYRPFFRNEDIESINYHLSPCDAFIAGLFGPDHPFDQHWQFDVGYVGGDEPEYLSVKPRDREWTEALDLFQLQQAGGMYSCQRVVDHFSAQLSNIKIKVSLFGAKLEEYKAKYGSPQSQYQWLSARPQLPGSWTIEKGQSSMAQASCEWVWMLKGPQGGENQARAALELFLLGFTFQYVPQQQQMVQQPQMVQQQQITQPPQQPP